MECSGNVQAWGAACCCEICCSLPTLGMDDSLEWVCGWFASECNGDWEQQHGITIESLDNPGWAIKIDLHDTQVPKRQFTPILVERSPSDWFAFELKEGAFFGYGDPSKLGFLLAGFRRYVETGHPPTR